MSVADFPSLDFPEVPAIRISLPAEWRPRAVSGTILGAGLDRGPESFSPNVIVTHERVAGGSWDASEAAVTTYVNTLADVQVIDRQRVTLGGRPWSVFEFAHVAAGVGTVIQIIAVTLVERQSVSDVIRVTASTDPVDVDVVLPQLRAIIADTVVVER